MLSCRLIRHLLWKSIEQPLAKLSARKWALAKSDVAERHGPFRFMMIHCVYNLHGCLPAVHLAGLNFASLLIS